MKFNYKLNLGRDLYLKGRIGWKGLKKEEYLTAGEYKIINATALMDGYVDWNNCGFIPKERYEDSPEIMLHENDLLISKDGTLGKIGYVKNLTTPCSVASGVFVLRNTMPDVIDFDYLYHLLKSSFFKKFINNRKASGSTINHLYQDDLEKFEIDLPPLAEQQRIAKILTDIDSKIAVNKKINYELEIMVKELYDFWFVQFDYPNAEGKPYKSSGGKMVNNAILKREIPEGWEVKKIGELFRTNRGVSYSTPTLAESGIPMINLASFTPNNSYNEKGIKYYIGEYSEDKILKPYDLVMCNTQQTAINYATDIIGRSMLIPDIFESDVLVSSHHVNTIKLKNDVYKFWMNYLFNSDYFHRYISYYASGTNIMGLSFNGVTDFEISIPDEKLLISFNKIAFDIEKKKSLLLKENAQLQQMRDELLPLLMNGQVSVKESKNV